MKIIKKFESFHNTGVDEGGEVVPKINPKRKQEAINFIDGLSPTNRPLAFKWLGKKSPKLSDPNFDSEFEKIKSQLVDYFLSNPNIRIGDIDIEKFTLPKKGGDGVARVQNIGNSSQTNSFRIGQ